MGLSELLDLPRIALSNGQTRRARILKALLSKPRLLLLDEPLTGLDVQNRSTVLEILHELHSACDPHIIIGLRMQDAVPDWITHLAVVDDGEVKVGPKEVMLQYRAHVNNLSGTSTDENAGIPQTTPTHGHPVVEMKNVSVTYGPRRVLKNITLTLREGQRYHLQGTNGSGKTTLLSLLTGDHPQSYTQLGADRHLRLFGTPRPRLATPTLHARIGVVTPELFDAFPRRAPDMSVLDALGTGFDGAFVPRALSAPERARCADVLAALGPAAWRDRATSPAAEDARGETERFARRRFMELPVGEQRMVLLMRALVGRQRLVLLDEVWSGMDYRMIQAARAYLRNGGVGPEQAVVVVTHLEEEVPWGTQDGVVRVLLKDGEIHGHDLS